MPSARRYSPTHMPAARLSARPLEPWLEAKSQMKGRPGRAAGAERPWQEIAGGVTCPVLLVTGDSDEGAIVTPEIAQEAVGLMANARIAHIAGAPHNIRWARFEAFIGVLQSFLGEMRAA